MFSCILSNSPYYLIGTHSEKKARWERNCSKVAIIEWVGKMRGEYSDCKGRSVLVARKPRDS